MICSTVRICVLVTGQEQILIELKSTCPVILTVDLSGVILSSENWSDVQNYERIEGK